MQGLHLTADLYECASAIELMTSGSALAQLCREAVTMSQLTVVDEKFFVFPSYQGQPGGVTGAVLLAESHLAIHTWPERASVTLDVYVCNFSTDNSSKAERLMADLIIAFKPRSQTTNRILRGSADPENRADELLLEWLNEHSAYGYRASRRLETLKSAHQTIEVFETPQFGKLFRLDGSYMTSERDEFFYHEALVHPAAIAHASPRTALVLGGGDGGSSEEILKHPDIQSVTIAELDPEVVRVARDHLASVHRGVFDNARVRLRIGDGFEFLRSTEDQYDLIVLDLTDPNTPAQRLYSDEFFALLAARLTDHGLVSLHLGSPVFMPERVANLIASLRRHFSVVRPLGLYIPLYGAYWSMAVASHATDPLSIDAVQAEARIQERGLGPLGYYNGEVHRALFALPNFYRTLAGLSG